MLVTSESIRAALSADGLLIDTRGPMPAQFEGVADDSRAVRPGTLFIAVRGSTRDGHDYLLAAADRGAVAAIVEDPLRTRLPVFAVRDGRAAGAMAAAAAYAFPARSLRSIAVTGTNGKSTTVGILRHLLDTDATPAASIGTLGVLIRSAGVRLSTESELTTPGPVELQRLLRALVDHQVRTVAIEVSSHSLDQERIAGLTFAAAVFTNLTRDHLDYHGTMEAYRDAKLRLIRYLQRDGVAVVNAGDEAWNALPPVARRVTFAMAGERATGPAADVRAQDVRVDPHGSHWTLVAGAERAAVWLPLIGDFNVVNALGATAAVWALGMPLSEAADRLATLPQVPGRLEMLHEAPTVLRDYAHTPDALARALQAVRPFTRGRLIVVFGAGGDRDRGKRPQMGAVAERLSDVAIVTSDNPRTEDPERILDDIEAGMSRPHPRRVDREEAIALALAQATATDLVLLAGKGHETYQVRGDVRVPFDERAIVHRLLGVDTSAPRRSGAPDFAQ